MNIINNFTKCINAKDLVDFQNLILQNIGIYERVGTCPIRILENNDLKNERVNGFEMQLKVSSTLETFLHELAHWITFHYDFDMNDEHNQNWHKLYSNLLNSFNCL